MIVVDGEAEQRIHAQAWWRHLTLRNWNVLIYVVVVPLSYSLGRILSSGRGVTTTLGGSTSTGTVAYQYLHFERCISRACSQEEAQQDRHDMESSYRHHDNIPPTSRSRNLPIFTGTAIDSRNAFRGATLCDNGNYKLARETFAEMFIQPAILIHPNPRLRIAIYVAATSPALTTTRAMLQQLEYFSTSIDQVYIFSNGDNDHEDLLEVGRSPDSNLTVHHVGHPLSMVLPSMDNHTSPQERISFDIVFLGREMTMVRDSSSSSSISFGPTFWSEHLDPKNGILVMPLVGHSYHDRIQRLQVDLVETGQRYYFGKVTDYESHHDTRFLHFAIAFKNKATYAHWHLNEAEYMLRMHKRGISYNDLQVLDGATMTTLAFPSRISTRAFCDLKYGNVCDEMEHSSGVDPFQDNIPYSKLEVKPSSLGELAGRGVFTTVDAPKGTYIDLETSSQSIHASWTTTDLIFPAKPQQKSLFDAMGWPLHHYFDGYGFYGEPFGEVSSFVDSGIMTFPNHGCNSSYNVGSALSVNEFDVILGQPPPDDFSPSFQRSVYDPLGERHALFDKVTSRSLRDIMAGEELFDNYIFFGGVTYFHDMVKSLRDQCRGMAGEIEEFQRQKSSQK